MMNDQKPLTIERKLSLETSLAADQETEDKR